MPLLLAPPLPPFTNHYKTAVFYAVLYDIGGLNNYRRLTPAARHYEPFYCHNLSFDRCDFDDGDEDNRRREYNR